MFLMKKICPVCGTTFETRGNYHIYCSAHCRKVHHKKVYYDKTRQQPTVEPGKRILRSFNCNKCHKLVLITSEKDRRTKFCSPRCEKLYWKHPRKEVKISLTKNENIPQEQSNMEIIKMHA